MGPESEIVNLGVGIKNHLDICFAVERRTYQGRTSTQLTLRDLRTAEAGTVPDCAAPVRGGDCPLPTSRP